MFEETFIFPQPPLPVVDKEQLIKSHLSLVEFWVDRMACQVPSYMTRDDMSSAAMMGLLDAASRFDPLKGILFKTFAERRIRGAIIDEARKMGWFSRSLRDKQSQLTDTCERLERQLGRSPEEHEVAAAMDMKLEDYQSLLAEVNHLGLVSLNETLDRSDDGRSLLDTLADPEAKSALDSLEARDLTRQLADHLASLTEKERLVVSLYYYEELTHK